MDVYRHELGVQPPNSPLAIVTLPYTLLDGDKNIITVGYKSVIVALTDLITSHLI